MRNSKDYIGKRCRKAKRDLIYHFGYNPGHPEKLDFDEDVYSEHLEKSVADDFDYTIELYGTIPSVDGDPNRLIID